MWRIFFSVVIILNVADTRADMAAVQVKPTNYFRSVVNCIEIIIEKALYFKPTVLYMIDDDDNYSDKKMFSEELIDRLIDKVPLMILEDADLVETNVTDLLMIEFYESCNYISGLSSWHTGAKHLIILNTNETSRCISEIELYGGSMILYDFTFIISDVLVTLIPVVNSSACNVTGHAIEIKECRKGLEKNDVFPSKNVINLNKCPFKVGARKFFPNTILKNNTNPEEGEILKDVTGFDVELVKIINDYLNGTLELHFLKLLGENAFASTAFIQNLLDGSLDVCAGLYRIYGDSVDYSGVYVLRSVIWTYYVERVKRSWKNLLNKVDGWHYFIIFYLIYSMVTYFISKFDRNSASMKNTLLYSWGALLGAVSLKTPRSNKLKILHLAYMILCIHVTAYMNIQLYSFLTVSEPPQLYNTLDDIMGSGKTLFLNSGTRFASDSKYLKYMNTSKHCPTTAECVKMAVDKKGITAILDSVFIQLQAETAVGDEARMVTSPEVIRAITQEMVLRKGYLVKTIQVVLQYLSQAGITQKLYDEAIGLSVVGKAKAANKKITNNSYNCGKGCQISLLQLAGVFYFWILGCGLSICVFIIELICKRDRGAL